MTNIYDQHQAAFANVSAYVILKDGERVATIAFKFPRDGAGRLYAYVHWIGVEMVRGHANGYGYDKKSAACESAAAKMTSDAITKYAMRLNDGPRALEWIPAQAFVAALKDTGGSSWERKLQDAGFSVVQAV